MEYVRHDRKLPAEKVWYVSFEGGDHLHLATSTDAAYGVAAAPSVATGVGAFAGPLARFLEDRGRPDPVEDDAWAVLRKLRLLGREARRSWLPQDLDAGLPSAERVERALLRELDRKRHPALLKQTHPTTPRDEQAIRAALTVLAVHRPVLTVIRLGEAERAVHSFDEYRAVLAHADEGLGRLEDAVAADEQMRGKTTFVVLPDLGRNEKPDAEGRLGADDASKQRTRVSVLLGCLSGLPPALRHAFSSHLGEPFSFPDRQTFLDHVTCQDLRVVRRDQCPCMTGAQLAIHEIALDFLR